MQDPKQREQEREGFAPHDADVAGRESAKTTVHWTSGTNIIAGIWLVLAPFALQYTDVQNALWNDIILGVSIALLAMIRTALPLQFEAVSWTNFVLGGWLVFAPFILDYSGTTAAVWNDIIVGLVVLTLAAWSAVASRKFSPSR